MERRYRVRFASSAKEDDSLMHFGIKGQKWGIRRFQNLDGTLTEEGRQRYGSAQERQNLANIVKNSVSKDGIEIKSVNKARQIIREHPVVRDMLKKTKGAYDDLSKAESARQKEEDSFYNDSKTYEKYLNKAVDAFMKEQKESGNTAGWTRKEAYDWFKYDDGDQGDRSSIELYKKSGEGKKLIAAEKAERQAYKTYMDACKSLASEYLGEYGNEPIKYHSKWTQTDYTRSTADRLTDFLLTRD